MGNVITDCRNTQVLSSTTGTVVMKSVSVIINKFFQEMFPCVNNFFLMGSIDKKKSPRQVEQLVTYVIVVLRVRWQQVPPAGY